MKNGFFQSQLMCTANDAVIDESEQLEIISQKRSFDSQESSSSSSTPPLPKSSSSSSLQQGKYVSPSAWNHNQQGVEVVLNPIAELPRNVKESEVKEGVVFKSCTAVDLDDDVSSDHSGSQNQCNRPAGETAHEEPNVHPVTNDNNDEEGDIISVGKSKKDLLVAWSMIAKQLEDEIAQGIVPLSGEIVTAVIEEDERTQGSDNSKCSFGYEKPIISKKSRSDINKKSKTKPQHSSNNDEPVEVLKSLFTDDQPVLDKTPSKLGKNSRNLPITGSSNILLDEQFDNTTCTWSESADSTIPTVIYIRRDIPPVVPDDEALGQNYTPQQLRAIHDYTNRISNNSTTAVTSPVSKSYIMKGLRFLTLGVIGSNNNNKEVPTTTTTPNKLKKIHLDDDASEAFEQTLIDI